MLRLRLTQTCQLCGTKFGRQGDLALHLQSVHPARWKQAKTNTHMLMMTCYTRDGCYCNPKPNQTSITHVCPIFRQISMMEQRVEHDLFLPWSFSAERLQTFLQSVQSHVSIPALVDSLVHRHFSHLWTDQIIAHMLSQFCLVCGGQHHAAVLSEHIKAFHADHCAWIPMIMPVLLEKFGQSVNSDYQCDWCRLVFNLPPSEESAMDDEERALLAQIHFQHHCPVLLQCCILLTHGVARHGRRSGHADDPSLQGDGSLTGSIHTFEGRRKRHKTNEETDPGFRSRTTRSPTASLDGHNADPTGRRPAVDEKTRLMDLLHANRAQRVAPEPGRPSPDMAHGGAEQEGPARPDGQCSTTSATSHATHGPASTGPSTEAGPGDGHGAGQDMDNEPQTPTDPTRWQLPISAMETSTAGSHANQTGGHTPEENAGIHEPAVRVGGGWGHDREVPCPVQGRQDPHCTLAAADLDEGGRASDPADDPPGIDGMGTPRDFPETTHPEPEQAGHAAEGALGQRERQTEPPSDGERQAKLRQALPDHLKIALATTSLGNVANHCYINAGFMATLWAFLCHRSFPSEFWGPGATTIVADCLRLAHRQIHLADIAWMHNLMRSWGNTADQGDAVEFIHFMLRGLNFAGFSHRWERRVQMGLLTSVRDENDAFAPVILHIDPSMADGNRVLLRDMIQDWHDHLGMVTALTTDTDLICVHIDRFVRSGPEVITKSNLSVGFHWGCSFPFFTDQSLQVTWKDFQVVAALAHQGEDGAGHYRAWLKVGHSTNPGVPATLALLTDDGRPAERVWTEPDWFNCGLTCLWLCSCDALKLETLPPHICNPASDSAPTSSGLAPSSIQEILQLFSG